MSAPTTPGPLFVNITTRRERAGARAATHTFHRDPDGRPNWVMVNRNGAEWAHGFRSRWDELTLSRAAVAAFMGTTDAEPEACDLCGAGRCICFD